MTSGMAESPAFTICDETVSPIHSAYRFCGIYVGGPPLPGQYRIIEILRSFKTVLDRDRVIYELQQMQSEFSQKMMKSAIEGMIEEAKTPRIRRESLERKAISVLYDLVENSSELKNLDPRFLVSAVIPVSHPAFLKMQQMIGKFKALPDKISPT